MTRPSDTRLQQSLTDRWSIDGVLRSSKCRRRSAFRLCRAPPLRRRGSRPDGSRRRTAHAIGRSRSVRPSSQHGQQAKRRAHAPSQFDGLRCGGATISRARGRRPRQFQRVWPLGRLSVRPSRASRKVSVADQYRQRQSRHLRDRRCKQRSRFSAARNMRSPSGVRAQRGASCLHSRAPGGG